MPFTVANFRSLFTTYTFAGVLHNITQRIKNKTSRPSRRSAHLQNTTNVEKHKKCDQSESKKKKMILRKYSSGQLSHIAFSSHTLPEYELGAVYETVRTLLMWSRHYFTKTRFDAVGNRIDYEATHIFIFSVFQVVCLYHRSTSDPIPL